MRELRYVIATTLLFVCLPLTSASAHKLRAFAYAEGAIIRGSAYFAIDAPAKGAHIRVLDPDGVIVAETTSDAQGRFTVAAHQRVDHRIIVDAGDGHRAEYTVAAAELPMSLPASATRSAVSASTAAPRQSDVINTPPRTSDEALDEMIERAVARQIGPLRDQLVNYEEKVRWRDILGGLGYILGITGLALWLRRGRDRRPRRG